MQALVPILPACVQRCWSRNAAAREGVGVGVGAVASVGVFALRSAAQPAVFICWSQVLPGGGGRPWL